MCLKKGNKILIIITIICIVAIAGTIIYKNQTFNNTDNSLNDVNDNITNNIVNNDDTNNQIETQYVGNARTMTFHVNDCEWAQKISDNNLVKFNYRQDAINQGYKKCKVCDP